MQQIQSNKTICRGWRIANKQRGLTLVELMVTLAVAIVMISVGVPLFSGVTANKLTTTQTNGLVASVQLARSEAIKRGEPVTLCPVQTAGATPPVCGTAADWDNGWTVYFDDGDVIDEHVRIWDRLAGNATVTTASATISFNSRGAATSGHTFELRQAEGSSGNRRCVTVTLAGQVRAWRFNPGAGETCP